jgi:hypothetical protein
MASLGWKDRAETAEALLLALTPGGSEFFIESDRVDIGRCYDFAAARGKTAVKAVKARKESDARLEKATELLRRAYVYIIAAWKCSPGGITHQQTLLCNLRDTLSEILDTDSRLTQESAERDAIWLRRMG